MYRINCFFILLLFSVVLVGQEVHNITDFRDIEDLTLNPGDTVILADGEHDYNSTVDIYAEGTASQPILIRPASPGGVVFVNKTRINLAGSYVIIDGFHWKGGEGASNFIQLRAKNFQGVESYAQHCTIQNCVMDGLTISEAEAAKEVLNSAKTKHRWIVMYGNYNNILNCSFMNKTTAGALILVELFYNNSCDVVGHTISNNYFYNYSKIDASLSNSGDSETIRVGTSSYQNYNCATTVSNNYFVQADGENEIISNKSSNNIYANNTFRRCRGSLVLRHGAGVTVDKNYFLGEDVDGTGGLRIVDSDHVITNNYIQDCITVISQAKWNNGLTFMGGSANSIDNCVSGDISNGYQKSENNYIANNTIINTNAPFFYNGDKGTQRNTGVVENNLVSFKEGNGNLTPIVEEDDPGDYTSFGSTLTYRGNVFDGTTLGIQNDGFSSTDISLEENGEIYSHNQLGKGADMGGFNPHTDEMVGNGIGACFLDANGEKKEDNLICTIQEIERLNIGSLSQFEVAGGSQTVTLSANVSWTATEDLDWVTISTASGSGDEEITVAVDANSDRVTRSGIITFQQDGGDLSASLNISQAAPELTELYDLINTEAGGGPVEILEFSKQQVGFDDGKDRFNYATNTLDKLKSTRWAANDLDDIPSGDIKADGEYIIYDLGKIYDLGLIQLSTDEGKDFSYAYQIWTSDSGSDDANFTKLIPVSEELMFSKKGTDEFQQTEVSVNARYVKLVGFGRFTDDGSERKSFWTNITEIEFFAKKDASLSLAEDLFNEVLIYPIPAKSVINLKNLKSKVDEIKIVSLEGKIVLVKNIENSSDSSSIDISGLLDGFYFINFSSGDNNVNFSKPIIIKH